MSSAFLAGIGYPPRPHMDSVHWVNCEQREKGGLAYRNKNCLLVFQKNDFTKAASSTISIYLYSVFQFRVGKNSCSRDES